MKGVASIRRLVNAVTGGAATTADGVGMTRDDGSGTDEPTVAEQFRSPDERVLTLLYASGGHLWQQDLITETGYSVGKVSELLSGMEADGQISRYWKDGRKVVTYPELHPQPADIDT